MADHVQWVLERMIPEFEDMQTSGLFTKVSLIEQVFSNE